MFPLFGCRLAIMYCDIAIDNYRSSYSSGGDVGATGLVARSNARPINVPHTLLSAIQHFDSIEIPVIVPFPSYPSVAPTFCLLDIVPGG